MKDSLRDDILEMFKGSFGMISTGMCQGRALWKEEIRICRGPEEGPCIGT